MLRTKPDTGTAHTPGGWNPRPFVPWSDVETSDYRAGYADGFHGYPFGSGHDGSRSRNAYLAGFNDGTSDAKAERR